MKGQFRLLFTAYPSLLFWFISLGPVHVSVASPLSLVDPPQSLVLPPSPIRSNTTRRYSSRIHQEQPREADMAVAVLDLGKDGQMDPSQSPSKPLNLTITVISFSQRSATLKAAVKKPSSSCFQSYTKWRSSKCKT